MKNTRSVFLLIVAGLSAAAFGQSSLPQSPEPQELPDVLSEELGASLERGDFEFAKQVCQSQIEASALVAEPGILAVPYLCLGEALYGLKNYDASAVAFSSAIDQLEKSAGVFDPRLVRPLEGLGKALMKLGRAEAAETALTHAKDITHRNYGIYNLLQSSIVNRLTRSYYDRGELAEASREQNFLFHAHEENYGEAPQLLPALRRIAKWHERIGRFDLARNDYRRALEIMKRAYGEDDLRLVGPLRDFARSYLNTPRGSGRVMSRAGANALMDIIRLYERQEFTDAVDVARSWSELGDWYVIGGRRSAAKAAYIQAGIVLRESASAESSDLFSWPLEIEYEDVPIGIRSSRLKNVPDGIAKLEFEFTVTAEGRVTNLVVLRDDLKYARFALEVGQRIKASRYRPRIIDGEPVATPGVRKIFRYDLTRSIRSAGKSQEQNSGTVAGDETSEVGAQGAEGTESVTSPFVAEEASDAVLESDPVDAAKPPVSGTDR